MRRELTSAIIDGHISPELPLPSSRDLAQQLSVSRNTVVLAYQRLIDEGYLISRERQGYFVNSIILKSRPEHRVSNNSLESKRPEWLKRYKFNLSVQRNIQKPLNWQKYQFPFIYGQSDPSLFPIADWRECLRQSQSISVITSGNFDYVDQDDEMLVEELCVRVLPRRGIWTKPQNLLVTIGAQNALFLTAHLLLKKDSVVGIENPGYPDARNIFSVESNSLKFLDVDEFGLVIDESVNQCEYIYVTPNHQSPTTVTMSIDRRLQLLKNANENDFIIIEDDYESEANYVHDAIPALKSMDKGDRVIYCGSVSKTLAPGLRLGFLVADEEFIKHARMLRRLLLRHPPALIQRTVALFLQLGHYDSHINRLNQVYKNRWELMGESLEKYLPNSTNIPEFGGSAFWVKGPDNLDANRLAEECRNHSILIEPGDVHFSMDTLPLNYFRLGFSSIPNDRVNVGIKKIAEFLKNST